MLSGKQTAQKRTMALFHDQIRVPLLVRPIDLFEGDPIHSLMFRSEICQSKRASRCSSRGICRGFPLSFFPAVIIGVMRFSPLTCNSRAELSRLHSLEFRTSKTLEGQPALAPKRNTSSHRPSMPRRTQTSEVQCSTVSHAMGIRRAVFTLLL